MATKTFVLKTENACKLTTYNASSTSDLIYNEDKNIYLEPSYPAGEAEHTTLCWQYLADNRVAERCLFRIDTSSLGADAVITSATVSFSIKDANPGTLLWQPVFLTSPFVSQYGTLRDDAAAGGDSRKREMYNAGNNSVAPHVSNDYFVDYASYSNREADLEDGDAKIFTCPVTTAGVASINKTSFTYILVKTIADYDELDPATNRAQSDVILVDSDKSLPDAFTLTVTYTGGVQGTLEPPTDLKVDSFDQSSNTLTISHKQDGSNALKGYNLYYKYSTESLFTKTGVEKPVSPYDRVVYLLVRDRDKTTQFYVTTINITNNESAPTSTISYTPTQNPPSDPRNFIATEIINEGGRTVKLTWSPPTDTTNLASYKVGIFSEKTTDNVDVPNTTTASVPLGTLEYTFNNLTNERFYSFFVSCVLSTGSESTPVTSPYIVISSVIPPPAAPDLPVPPPVGGGTPTLSLVFKDQQTDPPAAYYSHSEFPYSVMGQKSFDPNYEHASIFTRGGKLYNLLRWSFGWSVTEITNIESPILTSTLYTEFTQPYSGYEFGQPATLYPFRLGGDGSSDIYEIITSEDGERIAVQGVNSANLDGPVIFDSSNRYFGHATGQTLTPSYIQYRNGRYYRYYISKRSAGVSEHTFFAEDITNRPTGAGDPPTFGYYPVVDGPFQPFSDDEMIALGYGSWDGKLRSVKTDTKEFLYHHQSTITNIIHLFDVSNPGTGANITTNFTNISITPAQLGITVSQYKAIIASEFIKKTENILQGAAVFSSPENLPFETAFARDYDIVFFEVDVTNGNISNIIKQSFTDTFWKVSKFSFFTQRNVNYCLLSSTALAPSDNNPQKFRVTNLSSISNTPLIDTSLDIGKIISYTSAISDHVLVQNNAIYIVYPESDQKFKVAKLLLEAPEAVQVQTPTNFLAVKGTSTLSVNLDWLHPEFPNGTLLEYLLTNKTTSATKTLLPSATTYLWEELIYGQKYVFGLKAKNALGWSNEVISNSTSGTTPSSVPGTPIITNVISASGQASITWQAPSYVGSTPITYYKVKLYKSNSSPVEITVNAVTFTSTFSGLENDVTYYFSVAAINSGGIGAAAISATFTSSSGAIGPLVIKQSFNYVNFYDAPVVLDVNSSNYNGYVYEQDVVEHVYASITNLELFSPVIFPAANSEFVIQADENEYLFIIPYASYEYVKDIFDTPEESDFCLETAIRGQIEANNYPLAVEAVEKTDGGIVSSVLTISSTVPTTTFALSESNAVINTIIFGEEPLITQYYANYLVKNHIPTPQYDAATHKALIESKILLTRRNIDLNNYIESEGFNEDLGQNTYKITLPNIDLRPKKVEVFWFNDKNSYTYVMDYNGENENGTGFLYEKIRTEVDGQVNYELSPKEGNHGIVDYKTGIITGLILKDLSTRSDSQKQQYRAASIVGKNVVFPIRVFGSDKRLVFNKAGEIISIPVPEGTYTAENLATYLNNNDLFKNTYHLLAGTTSGQLFVQDTVLGPFNTLRFSDVSEFGAINLSVFGLTPTVISPPKLYISYSYALTPADKYNHIWYQTPHFHIKVKNDRGVNQFTHAHLNYVLDKIDIFRPITTVLDGIKVDIPLEETVAMYDTLSVSMLEVEPPYIIAFLPRTSPANSIIGSVNVTVINPDQQEDTELNGYTFV